jgi:cytosine/adenosine deaminase-related metal-dependent hydrolase
MPASLIRSRAMITQALDRHHWNEVANGAVVQEDGVITAIGSWEELSRKHPDLPVVGTGNEILLPGFVNGHHHIGLTPVQLGSLDMPLELWFVARMVARNLNLYLDTLYSAFEMIASGVTTVQHLHGWLPGKLAEVDKGADEAIRAYEDVGMEDDVPTPTQVFRMATSGGAKTTAFGDGIGALEVGRAADLVLIDWRQISYPYLDAETPLLDACCSAPRPAACAR